MKKHIAAIYILGAAVALSATTFTGRLVLSPSTWSHTKTVGSAEIEETFSAFLDWSHTTGTNANQMTDIVVDSSTLTNSQSRTIDLTSIADNFGDTISFSTVRFLALVPSSANTGYIEMGNAASGQFTNWVGGTNHTIRVRAGGVALFVAPDLTGYNVGTNGNLKITNGSTNSASYNLYIGGSE